jgi:hypothetical protein
MPRPRCSGLVAGLTARVLVVGQRRGAVGLDRGDAGDLGRDRRAVGWCCSPATARTPRGYMGAGGEEYRAVLRAAATPRRRRGPSPPSPSKLEFSRGVLFVAVPTMVVATTTGRHVLRRRLASARDRGECLQPAVLVGDARGRARAGPPHRGRSPHHRPRGPRRVRHRAVRPGARTRGVLRDPCSRRRGRHPRRGRPSWLGGGRRRERPRLTGQPLRATRVGPGAAQRRPPHRPGACIEVAGPQADPPSRQRAADAPRRATGVQRGRGMP